MQVSGQEWGRWKELGCAAVLGVPTVVQYFTGGVRGAWTRFWGGVCVSGTSEVWLLLKPRHGSFNGNECTGVTASDSGGLASSWQWQSTKALASWGLWTCCKDSAYRQSVGGAAPGPSLRMRSRKGDVQNPATVPSQLSAWDLVSGPRPVQK